MFIAWVSHFCIALSYEIFCTTVYDGILFQKTGNYSQVRYPLTFYQKRIVDIHWVLNLFVHWALDTTQSLVLKVKNLLNDCFVTYLHNSFQFLLIWTLIILSSVYSVSKDSLDLKWKAAYVLHFHIWPHEAIIHRIEDNPGKTLCG